MALGSDATCWGLPVRNRRPAVPAATPRSPRGPLATVRTLAPLRCRTVMVVPVRSLNATPPAASGWMAKAGPEVVARSRTAPARLMRSAGQRAANIPQAAGTPR